MMVLTIFNFINEGPDSLNLGIEYTFTGNNSSFHLFSMFITDSLGNTTYLISNLSFRGSQSFTLDPNTDYSRTQKLTYVKIIQVWSASFNIVPESFKLRTAHWNSIPCACGASQAAVK